MTYLCYQIAPYAAIQSCGRLVAEAAPSLRTEFQRDRDRIIHSAAFRRLEYKTQVFVNHEGDMFRTRLTHTIEVAQLARTVSRSLRLNEDLTEAIALAHDLGHTPFGHAGQTALDDCMSSYGGFEHNLQALRVVDELEERYLTFKGLNLTFETREGILKHCSKSNAHKLGKLGDRFLNRTQPSLEAQVADVSDAIAYNNHDVDDALRAQLITVDALRNLRLYKHHVEFVEKQYPDANERLRIYHAIRGVIDDQIGDLVSHSQTQIESAKLQHICDVRRQPSFLVGFSNEMKQQHLELKRFLREHVYKHYRVLRMNRKAGQIITDLFGAFLEDPKMLPPDKYNKLKQMEKSSKSDGSAVAISDYISGMTDRYAIAEHQRIFNPSELT